MNSFSSFGYFLTSQKKKRASSSLLNFNVVGVGSNCFTFTWTTPTVAVTTYNLTYNGGIVQNIPVENITKNAQYGYSGYTLKGINITIPFYFTFGSDATTSVTKTVDNISAFSVPSDNASYTTSVINSFTQIKFISSVAAFTMPTTTDGLSNRVNKAGVMIVGQGGTGGNGILGGNSVSYYGGGGGGGGVVFYPLLGSYSATPPESPDVVINSSYSMFSTLIQAFAGGSGGNGYWASIGGGTLNKNGAGGIATSATVNNIILVGGNGSHGDNNNYLCNNGISLVVPEMDISFNFSGGGCAGGCSSTTVYSACELIRSIYGNGMGAIFVSKGNTTPSKSGVAYTGGGGGGGDIHNKTGSNGGSGVVYLYYSSYFFTVQ